ncbi:tlde1 domain-containing protein [Bosea sp. CS1GBMeth4]|uniref:tlde1 domain-containing protein n=1 Tax=Bosea sp. CS1GBMeth4 TaxID=1892849 RepID=UPI001FCF1DCD|nr:tlde1 domain-containing protein [Bosea sp. CS1GBMeth4]
MRCSNKFAGYSYSLKRQRRSPFIRLGVLVALAGVTMAGLSSWAGRQGEPAEDASITASRKPPRALPPTTLAADTSTPLLRPGYVAGYVAQSFAASAPLPGRFQSAVPTRQVAVADPEVTGSIAPSDPVGQSAATTTVALPPPAEPPRIALIAPRPVPRPADLKLPAPPEPRLAARATSRQGKDVVAKAEPAADNRNFFEKLFGVNANAPQSSGERLAYAAPQDDITQRSGRGSGLTVAPAPAPMASMPAAGSKTAVYDISARTVYLPNGERLEANSGLGDKMNDIRFVHVRMQGPTPPHVYDLTEREALFHGVRAIRMHPVGGSGRIFGRAGLLVHNYLLGPRGDSNGCVSVKDYDRFLQAFLRGEVKRLVVVAGRS